MPIFCPRWPAHRILHGSAQPHEQPTFLAPNLVITRHWAVCFRSLRNQIGGAVEWITFPNAGWRLFKRRRMPTFMQNQTSIPVSAHANDTQHQEREAHQPSTPMHGRTRNSLLHTRQLPKAQKSSFMSLRSKGSEIEFHEFAIFLLFETIPHSPPTRRPILHPEPLPARTVRT